MAGRGRVGQKGGDGVSVVKAGRGKNVWKVLTGEGAGKEKSIVLYSWGMFLQWSHALSIRLL
jgi:hypothetical protein